MNDRDKTLTLGEFERKVLAINPLIEDLARRKVAEAAADHYDGPTDTVITDAELDAATLAYMDVRYPGGAEAWRKAWPTAWRELRDRMRFALLAAAAERERS